MKIKKPVLHYRNEVWIKDDSEISEMEALERWNSLDSDWSAVAMSKMVELIYADKPQENSL